MLGLGNRAANRAEKPGSVQRGFVYIAGADGDWPAVNPGKGRSWSAGRHWQMTSADVAASAPGGRKR